MMALWIESETKGWTKVGHEQGPAAGAVTGPIVTHFFLQAAEVKRDPCPA